VGNYSKDCPKLKLGNGASKVIALTSNLGQGECNRLIFLKGKLFKREVLCLLDTGGFPQLHNPRKCGKNGVPFGGAQGIHGGALCEWDSPSHQVPSKRCAPPIGELERQGGLVNFHLGGNGLHFGNGIYHKKQCAHRRAQ
jgi:hypothetical protein